MIQKLINNFFCHKLFDNLPFLIQKKFRKLNNAYFSITAKNKLPKSNYFSSFTIKYQQYIIDNFNTKNYISKNSFNKLRNIINKINIDKINLLDFGAGDINTYLELRNLKKLKYFYLDIPIKNKIIKKLVLQNNLKNIKIINNSFIQKLKINFCFFGSSLQYYNNYEEILKILIKNKCKYFLFSGITLFSKNLTDSKTIVAKQLNVLPKINYLYFFNKKNFLSFFKNNNYKINFIKRNQFKKINFTNLNFYSKKIEYVDIFFEKK